MQCAPAPEGSQEVLWPGGRLGPPASPAKAEMRYDQRQPRTVANTDTELVRSIYFYSWNIGGVKVQQALEAAAVSDKLRGLPDPEFILLQEVSREAAGWRQHQLQGYKVVEFRDDMAWRGNAILVKEASWTVVRKKACAYGVWVRVKRRQTGEELWLGSVYLSTGVNADTTQGEIQVMMSRLPSTDLPVLLGGDFNNLLKWHTDGADTWHVPDNLKARYISSALENRGMAPIHPPVAQLRTPTSRPRKRTAMGNQIDGIAGKNGHEIDWHILEESYVEINTDHERCRGRLVTKGARAKVWHADTGPRVVIGPIPPQPRMDQEQLETLAEKYTGKRKTESYRDQRG